MHVICPPFQRVFDILNGCVQVLVQLVGRGQHNLAADGDVREVGVTVASLRINTVSKLHHDYNRPVPDPCVLCQPCLLQSDMWPGTCRAPTYLPA